MRMLISISDRDVSKAISIYLNKKNIENDIANDGIQALMKLVGEQFDSLLIEDDIVRLEAKDVLERIKERNIKVTSISIKNKTVIDWLDLIDNEFDLVVSKPYDIKSVLEIITSNHKDYLNNDLKLDYTNGLINYKDNDAHLTIPELMILEKLLNDKKIETEEIKYILKEGNLNVISNYIEAINYKLKKINYICNIKSIEKGYELVNL
ncbi:MAG: hypothetical protein K6A63_02040 [Acholeplasmatales bacterium]|nr:hypothetical protein [Acholeplasmatales bacterium]